MLEQIAIVACDFDDKASIIKTQLFSYFLAINPGMIDPAGRIRRKIGIFSKNIGRTEIFFQLHQIAVVAHERIQRIKRLHVIKLICSEKTLTRRRHSKIHKSVLEKRPAQAATSLLSSHACTPRYARRLDGHTIYLALPGPLWVCGLEFRSMPDNRNY